MNRHIAYISAGSNMGDKLLHCRNGIASLARSETVILLAQSPFYITEPLDYRDQDWFVNAVVKIETSFDPFQLMGVLKAIERETGRKGEGIKFGPRILDLDIVLFDDVILSSPELEIPHPRMHKRRFVLQPICDIDPKIVHPVLKKKMRDLLDGLDGQGQRIVQYT